ncbi:MAG: hypothetical protein ABIQ18_34665 [Umezawaea sp.]
MSRTPVREIPQVSSAEPDHRAAPVSRSTAYSAAASAHSDM